ncbi:MAG: hypothetical protein GY711_09735 [bacterium]|nr:hypothetical protein [bacterium]
MSISPSHPTDPSAVPGPGGSGTRRTGLDRRSQPTPRFSRYTLLGGRRGAVRRPDEREGTFVDRYGGDVLAAVIWIALMNIGDSYFTIVHLQSGGIELNPVAARLLETGLLGFVLSKSVLIGLALLVLTLHKNFWLARVGLWIAAASYTALVGYHLMLF